MLISVFTRVKYNSISFINVLIVVIKFHWQLEVIGIKGHFALITTKAMLLVVNLELERTSRNPLNLKG